MTSEIDRPWRDVPETPDASGAPVGPGTPGVGAAGPAVDERVEPVAEPEVAQGSSARAFFDWVVVVVIALLVAFVVRGFVLAHFVVDGSSMYSTLESGDRVFVNKLSYRLHDPNRGDVVVLHQITAASERDLIKRVIALPGETIEMKSCVVRITRPGELAAQILVEPYLDSEVVTPTNCGQDVAPLVVPEDHVFVMGDNRGGSQDSRSIGTVSEDDLVGRAFTVFWPRDNWQWL